MTQPPRPSLGRVAIEENYYKADQVILEHYQGFSKEIIQLASLGIAVLGYLVKDIATDRSIWPPAGSSSWLLVGAAVAFLVAIACALTHRYCSTHGFGRHVRAVRALMQKPPDEDRVIEEESRRKTLYTRSRRLLKGASAALWSGAFCVAAWIALALLKSPTP